jgi:hypothetical protein
MTADLQPAGEISTDCGGLGSSELGLLTEPLHLLFLPADVGPALLQRGDLAVARGGPRRAGTKRNLSSQLRQFRDLFSVLLLAAWSLLIRWAVRGLDCRVR